MKGKSHSVPLSSVTALEQNTSGGKKSVGAGEGKIEPWRAGGRALGRKKGDSFQVQKQSFSLLLSIN